jgi:hypothetical protein
VEGTPDDEDILVPHLNLHPRARRTYLAHCLDTVGGQIEHDLLRLIRSLGGKSSA